MNTGEKLLSLVIVFFCSFNLSFLIAYAVTSLIDFLMR
tara:strand:+ start:1652 stop:1765 length:114 start_codon:yes stop_codon:yes gene_type:complete